MLSAKLANAVENELKAKNNASFNLNFKIEGQDTKKFDIIAKGLKKSRTELAKFIISNSLDDLVAQLGNLCIDPSQESIAQETLDEAIIRITKPKISDLSVGATFELKEIIGEKWDEFGEHGDKNRAGKRFKKLAETGQIESVRFVHKKINNHALYKKL